MLTQSLTRLTLAVSGLALSLTAGAGIASAGPDLSPIVNTTCNYSQVMAALNAENPAAAADFNANSLAPSLLQNFLASPPSQRQRTINQLQSYPEAGQYMGTIVQVAGSCNNY